MLRMQCNGYLGQACRSQYAVPSGLLPLSEFTPQVRRDGQGNCQACRRVSSAINNPLRPIWYAAAGGRAVYYAMTDIGRAAIRAGNMQPGLFESAVRDPHRHENAIEYTEATITAGKRKRNQTLVADMRSLYNTCCIEGCDSDIFDVAHIHPHKNADSSDTADNMLPLCPNHHTALDRGRMYITQDLDTTWFSGAGEILENSKIVLHQAHNVDTKWIVMQVASWGWDAVPQGRLA